MATPVPENSIWSQMKYVPPRGQCNFKTGMLTTCTCRRFMLHPIKIATSFECDGCSHHASHHDMENKLEDEIVRRWQTEEKELELLNSTNAAGRPKKRPRNAICGQRPTRLANGKGQNLLEAALDANQEDFVIEEVESEGTVSSTAGRRGGRRQ
ncbi:hypothetical protein EJ05DRAFT_510247 [Pseudovirgaria hyperparasitica]|uniref:Uncharacterized protein n=1 Tax=Pseudovirgaria hyperparasitica TaxID=470096 RepID=A0A6A6W8T6_9PEZI|nr:uncharacterized protein EJ05DRAFT_510247 [Pseudovirgaria hyperparasitica]KAF2758306.1 hypothetical protein EJ05DRAFT_510247 [Pseudovirgaria hyperparasitica]